MSNFFHGFIRTINTRMEPVSDFLKEETDMSDLELRNTATPPKGFVATFVDVSKNPAKQRNERSAQLRDKRLLRRRNMIAKNLGAKTYMADKKREALSKQMADIAKLRFSALGQWDAEQSVFKKRSEAEDAFDSYMKKKTAQERRAVYGDVENNENKIAEGFHTSSGMGKFVPFMVQNGIIRGGLTARGKQVTYSNGDVGFAIPTKPAGDKLRELVSVYGNYKYPGKLTRIIKFVRGHWGMSKTKSEAEPVWQSQWGGKRARADVQTFEVKDEKTMSE